MASIGINTDLDFSAPTSSTPAVGASKILKLLTASRAVVSNGSGDLAASSVTSTELGYLSGVTSAIQTQLGTKITSGAAAIVNADVSASAAIALSKLATVTANRAIVSGAGGVLEAATATKDQVNALSGRTAGAVPYISSSGLMADTANLKWDNTNSYFQVGPATAGRTFHVSALNSSIQFKMERTGSSAGVTDFGCDDTGWKVWGGGYDFSAGHVVVKDRQVGISPASASSLLAQFSVTNTATSRITAVLRAVASQTANIREEQDSSGNILSGRNAKGKALIDGTLTTSGTTGAQTINKPAGRVNFAAGATSLVVTCDQCNTSCIVKAFVQTNDTTMKSVVGVPSSGSFTLYPNAAPTAETAVFFEVTEVV